jgi:hypothetical protein
MANEVNISQENWDKIINYAQAAYDLWKTEIGGMAIVYKDDSGDYIVDNPVILKQEVSGGNTILDKDALSEYYTKTAMKYKDIQDLQFLWWHSHHTMAAFWSGTDLKAIDEFNEGKISMSLVVNLREEYKFRINVWEPIEAYEDIELNIIGAPERTVPENIVKETKALCSKEKPMMTGYGNVSWYKPGKGSKTQTSLFNEQKEMEHREMIDYNRSYGLPISNIEEDPLNYCIQEIDKWINGLCDGTINYNQFKYRCSKLKDTIIERSLDDMIMIDIPTKKEVEGQAPHMTAWDLIDFEPPEVFGDTYADYINQWR